MNEKKNTNMTMRKWRRGACAIGYGVVFLTFSLACEAPQELTNSQSPEGASVYLISPINGAVVSDTLIVRFGLKGMGIAPAGTDVTNTGHHHLLIDLDVLPPMDQPLPKTDQVVHFGGGQTEADIELPPGEHTLQLLLGSHLHVPHDPPVISERITITVK